MKLTEIKASKDKPVYVNMNACGIVGHVFHNNLKWDGENLFQAKHDSFCTKWAWVSETDVSAKEILGDKWIQKEEGPLKLDHVYGSPRT